ncbi:MAG: ferritin family protein [Candidatus Omnitrophica bacterium]|nr:ferritin family protein [Candidatus Omnitrophota bacterium]
MDERYSVSDIIEVAVEIEKNGAQFYSGFAKKCKDKAIARFFNDMAEEEKKHEKDFLAILSSIGGYQPCQAYGQEYLYYLNAVAGGYLFKSDDDFRKRVSDIDTVKDAVDFSLGIEKDSILIYEQMKKILPDKDKPVIEMIIDQEKSHVRLIWGIRENLSKGGLYGAKNNGIQH